MTPVAIEINGFSHSLHSSAEAILKRIIFVAKWDKRFEKREAGLRLSQSRAFISAASMIWFCNFNGVFFSQVCLGAARRHFLQAYIGQR